MEIQKAAIPSIKALQVFEQVAHFGNVARAAEELNITPSAASHQLAKLEKLVGNSLFNRSAKGVSLTLAGETYLREISQLLLNLAQATAQIRDQKENNALRIHCAPSFGLLWLLPRLKQLHEPARLYRYPRAPQADAGSLSYLVRGHDRPVAVRQRPYAASGVSAG